MKVVHLSTSDMGGAGIATKRLHLAMRAAGIDSSFVTQLHIGEKTPGHFVARANSNVFSDRLTSAIRRRLPSLSGSKTVPANRPAGYDHFSLPYAKIDIASHQQVKDADIVHLHWVSDGFLDYGKFFNRIRKPVVWTLHDANPFSGGCHYPDGSTGFMRGCADCPQLSGTGKESLAAESLQYKIRSLEPMKTSSLLIVSPSVWLSELSSRSTLFKRYGHKVIPNVLNAGIFKPRERSEARRQLGVDPDAEVVLFAANDVGHLRKGIGRLTEAVNGMQRKNLLICTIGREMQKNIIQVKHRHFGFVANDEELASIYAIADVFVLPSMAENFPNTILEALFCGVPVCASGTGGIPEQVNSLNGRLFDPVNPEELRTALTSILENPFVFDRQKISADVKKRFSPEQSLKTYLAVYKELLAGK